MEFKKLISNLLIVAIVLLAAAGAHSHVELDEHGHSVTDEHEQFCLTCELAAQAQVLAIPSQGPQLVSIEQATQSYLTNVSLFYSKIDFTAIRAPPTYS